MRAQHLVSLRGLTNIIDEFDEKLTNKCQIEEKNIAMQSLNNYISSCVSTAIHISVSNIYLFTFSNLFFYIKEIIDCKHLAIYQKYE